MQRNRGQNNPLDSRNPLVFAQENAMSEELKTMVLQQRQMLMNMSLGQGLMNSSAQNLQLQSQGLPSSLFSSLSNVLPGAGVMSTLLSASNLGTPPLVSNNFISGPSMVPPPTSVPSTTQSGSSLNRNSVFNASGKNIFALKKDSQFQDSRKTGGSSRIRDANLDSKKWTHNERFSETDSFDRSRNWARDREGNKESNERSWSNLGGETASSSKNVFSNKSPIKDNDRWKSNVRDDEKLSQRSSEEMRWSSKDRSDEKRWNDTNVENKIEYRFHDESRSKRSWEEEQNRNREDYRSFQEHRGDNWNKKAKLSHESWNQTRGQVAWDKNYNESEFSFHSVEPNREYSSSKNCEKQLWSNTSKNSNENVWKMHSSEQNWSRHDEPSWSGRSPESDDKHWNSNYSKTNDTLSSYSNYEDTRFNKSNDFENQRRQNKETHRRQDKKWSNTTNIKEFDASMWAPKPKKEPDQSREKDTGCRSDERSGKSAQHQSWLGKEHKIHQGKTFDRDRKTSFDHSIRNVSKTTKMSGEEVSGTPRNFLYPDPDQRVKDVWSGFNNTENAYNMAEDTQIERESQLSVLKNEQIRSLQEKKEAEQQLYMMMMKIKQQKEMEDKMGYLDSQLELLDERMSQISGPLTERLQERKIPEVWDFKVSLSNSNQERNFNEDSGNADLRLKLMSKKDSKGANIAPVDSSGGWSEDMVLVCPVTRSNKLTVNDVSVLKEQLSERIHKLLDNNSQDVQPRILGSKMVCNGWFLIHCGDESTLDWVLSWKPPRPVRSRYPLKIRKASDAASIYVISIFLKGIKDKDFKKIYFRLINQNFHADSRTWNRVPHPVVSSSGTEVSFFVDRHCLNLLKKNSWKVFYDLGCYRAKLVKSKGITPLKTVN